MKVIDIIWALTTLTTFICERADAAASRPSWCQKLAPEFPSLNHLQLLCRAQSKLTSRNLRLLPTSIPTHVHAEGENDWYSHIADHGSEEPLGSGTVRYEPVRYGHDRSELVHVGLPTDAGARAEAVCNIECSVLHSESPFEWPFGYKFEVMAQDTDSFEKNLQTKIVEMLKSPLDPGNTDVKVEVGDAFSQGVPRSVCCLFTAGRADHSGKAYVNCSCI